MIRDYMLVSPSLDGILSHDTLSYEGIERPVEIIRALDGPARRKVARMSGGDDKKESDDRKGDDVSVSPLTEVEHEVLEKYFHDLYGVFMKKLSQFVIAPDAQANDIVQLQAMLQEMIKVKSLKGR